jgi:hypothetical protein
MGTELYKRNVVVGRVPCPYGGTSQRPDLPSKGFTSGRAEERHISHGKSYCRRLPLHHAHCQLLRHPYWPYIRASRDLGRPTGRLRVLKRVWRVLLCPEKELP